MKYKKPITILVVCIAVLSVIACLTGILMRGGPGEHTFLSIRGEAIKIYGIGLYQNESASQRLSLWVQDYFTLIILVPLLIVSLLISLKGSLKARLLLTGTLVCFLYTYIMYSFMREYNQLFLIYVTLMGASLFAVLLCIMSFDFKGFSQSINHRMPVRFIGGFQILLALGLISTWLPQIIASLINGIVPIDLEHYNTLSYEAIDLGIMVPALLVSAVLLMKRRTIGYLLSSILIMQSLSMITLISILTIVQVLNGVEMPVVMALMFPVFNIIIIFCLIIILKNIGENNKLRINRVL